eukprot:CAMPEP_0194773364 /NCGR_PEP_ID=MMETSP0323_2-20130528/54630_1 /TAXON_ID=2866 ORGANISM="Crypthecodinium cohnii, Strain Seligo" /NCGR_SAMPLE_ID=MMETSP0323_2 /ASSEMBLY_ACC=CAM_ASM_000346 /LENGTH=137 /DNA_ID=CAMNT_0039708371 /DNA_START=286 /DNA_END=696 /DNA_ORIENTATION=-
MPSAVPRLATTFTFYLLSFTVSFVVFFFSMTPSMPMPVPMFSLALSSLSCGIAHGSKFVWRRRHREFYEVSRIFHIKCLVRVLCDDLRLLPLATLLQISFDGSSNLPSLRVSLCLGRLTVRVRDSSAAAAATCRGSR